MNAIHVRCPAKVNLTLEILGQRPDGYHELRTLFHAVSLYDELTVTPAERNSLTISGLPGVPADGSNLCLRALEAFRRRLDMAVPVAVELHKRIPLQAGLGGGSSDAAGMLVALASLRGDATVGVPALGALAAELGSDVPFFLHGGAMIGSGRGEVLEPVSPLSGSAFVLAKPEAAVSTAAAYSLVTPADYTDGSATARCAACLRAGCALPDVASEMYNVFARPVEQLRPAIRDVRQRLLELNAQAVLLCGSGAAVFGLFRGLLEAEQAAARLRAEQLWAVAAEPVPDGWQVTRQ